MRYIVVIVMFALLVGCKSNDKTNRLNEAEVLKTQAENLHVGLKGSQVTRIFGKPLYKSEEFTPSTGKDKASVVHEWIYRAFDHEAALVVGLKITLQSMPQEGFKDPVVRSFDWETIQP